MINYTLFRFAQLVNCPESTEDAAGCNTTLPEVTANSASLSTILTIVFGTITAVTVLIIVVQGIKYVLSYGEPEKTTQARRGIIYAVVGLIVVLLADVIVAFALGRFL
jgi:hypothetical protein